MSLITISALPATSGLTLTHAIPVDSGTVTAKTSPQGILNAGLMTSAEFTTGTSTDGRTISPTCLKSWISASSTTFSPSLTGGSGAALILTADNTNTSFPIKFGSNSTPLAQIKGVYDSATAGHLEFHTTTSGASSEKIRIGSAGQLGIGSTPSYGTAGQVLTSGGASAAPTWTSVSVSSITGALSLTNSAAGDLPELGTELITTTPADWNVTSGWSNSGYTTFTDVSALDVLSFKTAATMPTGYYYFTFNVNYNAGSAPMSLQIGSSSVSISPTVSPSGAYALSFNLLASSTWFIMFYGGMTGYSISNLSIKKIIPRTTVASGLAMYDSTNTLRNTLSISNKDGNILLGLSAGGSLAMPTAIKNIAIGSCSLQYSGIGSSNIAIGDFAHNYSYSGNTNIAIGSQSMCRYPGGNQNVAIGYNAMNSGAKALSFTVVNGGSGYTAGSKTLAYSSGSTAISYGSVTIVVSSGVIQSATVAAGGIGIGYRDLTTILSVSGGTGGLLKVASISGEGTGNIAIGGSSACCLTSGLCNVMIGFNAGLNSSCAHANTFIGPGAGQNNVSGSCNIAIGCNSADSLTTGGNNTYLNSAGSPAGVGNVGINTFNNTGTGNYNLAIGVNSSLSSVGNNNITIGCVSGQYMKSNNIVLGTGSFICGMTLSDSNISIGKSNASISANAAYNIMLGNSITEYFGSGVGMGTNPATRNILIGNDISSTCATTASCFSTSFSSAIAIGNNHVLDGGNAATSNNTTIIGNPSITLYGVTANNSQTITVPNMHMLSKGDTVTSLNGVIPAGTTIAAINLATNTAYMTALATGVTTSIVVTGTKKTSIYGTTLSLTNGNSTTATYLAFSPSCSTSTMTSVAKIGGYHDSGVGGHLEFYTTSGTTETEWLRLGSSGQLGLVSGGNPNYGTTGQVLTSSGMSAAPTWSYSNIPQNSKIVDYTLALSDSGGHIYHPSTDTSTRTWTIPANAITVFPIGTTVVFVNDTGAGAITIAIGGTDTLILAGAGTTGNRTLAANGMATAIKITTTKWIINGAGLT